MKKTQQMRGLSDGRLFEMLAFGPEDVDEG